MVRKLTISGYDLTKYVKDLPLLHLQSGFYGNPNFTNDIIKLEFDRINKIATIFNKEDINSIKVLYTVDTKTAFSGFVDTIILNEDILIVNCKSYMDKLINTEVLRYPYVIDNQYPAYILSDFIKLVGLTINKESYSNALAHHQQIGLKYSVTDSIESSNNLIQELMRVSVGLFYLHNDKEFYYDTFDKDFVYSPLLIAKTQWIDKPSFSIEKGLSSNYNGTAIKFGTTTPYYTLPSDITPIGENPSQTIDISNNSVIYTDNIVVAQFIQDLFDYIGVHNKVTIIGNMRKELAITLTRQKYIKLDYDSDYKDLIFKVTSIKELSNDEIKIEITGIAFS